MKRNTGFAMISLLAMMPLLMAALIAYLLLNTSLQSWMETSHLCRTELLKTQDQVSQDLQKLLDLNSSVKLLRAKILATKAAIATALASGQTYALPPLRQALLVLQQEERALGLLQKSLLAAANLKMLHGPHQASQKIRQQYSLLQKRLSEFILFRLVHIHSLPRTLAVEPDRPAAVAAIYYLKSNFKQQQALHLIWRTELTALDAQWTKKWFRLRSERNDSCSASLELQNGKLQSLLSEGKSLLK